MNIKIAITQNIESGIIPHFYPELLNIRRQRKSLLIKWLNFYTNMEVSEHTCTKETIFAAGHYGGPGGRVSWLMSYGFTFLWLIVLWLYSLMAHIPMASLSHDLQLYGSVVVMASWSCGLNGYSPMASLSYDVWLHTLKSYCSLALGLMTSQPYILWLHSLTSYGFMA